MSCAFDHNIGFGYHDNDRCRFDLWSPVDDPDGCAVENRAFSSYCKHEQEKEDIIQRCIAEYQVGNYEFSINLDDDMSDEDLEYIQSEIQRRLR